MAKTGQDATAYKNNRWILRFSVVDEDTAGEPALDLTGYIVKYAIARLNGSGDPITDTPLVDLRSDVDSEVVITNAAGGIVEVTLDTDITDTLSPKNYYHELEVFDGSGNPVVTATGTLTVLPNVVNA